MKLLKFEYTPLNVVCDTDVLKLLPAKVIKTFKKDMELLCSFSQVNVFLCLEFK